MARPKLLLADDSVTIRKVVELTFADEGIDVTTAADAETAMQKFVEVQPDIVLVDIGLPGTTGYQICEMIKQDDGTKHIPVLLLVGSFEPFDQDEAERVCSDGFLTKPFHSIRDLVARVWDLLGRETAPEEPTAVATNPSDDVADIEHLYDSSFANTAEIEEFDTVDDLLGDSGMDDELIEASTPSYNGSEGAGDEPSTREDAVPTKEFDWSPEALVVEKEYRESDTLEYEDDAFDDISLHETVADDQSGAAWRPDNGSSIVLDPVAEDIGTQAAEEPRPGAQKIDDPEDDDGDGELDEGISEPPSDEIAETDLSSQEDAEAYTYEGNSPFEETVESTSSASAGALSERRVASEPSPELISLIAQRVIDHLSDDVVREIAKEAVPRIAEKLIREALEQERKA